MACGTKIKLKDTSSTLSLCNFFLFLPLCLHYGKKSDYEWNLSQSITVLGTFNLRAVFLSINKKYNLRWPFSSSGLYLTTPLLVARRCCNTDSSRPIRSHNWVQAPPPRLHGPIHCHYWSGRPTGRRLTWCCTCIVLMVRCILSFSFLQDFPLYIQLDNEVK